MRDATKRFWIGCEWGLIGTLAMTTVMLIVYFASPSISSQPLPLAITAGIISRVFGVTQVSFWILLLGIILQLVYGAVWGGLLAASSPNVTIGKAVGVAVGLWALMWIFYVPMVGGGVFSFATNPAVWVLTLVFHLIYGVTMGAGLHRIHEPLLEES